MPQSDRIPRPGWASREGIIVPQAPAAQASGPSAPDRALIIETLHRLAMAWSENNSHMIKQCFTDNASMTVTEAGERSLGTYETREAIGSALSSELQIQDTRQRVIFNNPVIDDLGDRTALITAVFLVHGYRSTAPVLMASGAVRAQTRLQPDGSWRIEQLIMGFDNALNQYQPDEA